MVKDIWRTSLGLCLCALLLTACGGKALTVELSDALTAKDEDIVEMLPGGRCTLKNGMLMEVGWDGEIAVYYDNINKIMVPLCTKADCRHDVVVPARDATCTAVLLAGDCSSRMSLYQGDLWYIAEDGSDSMENQVLCRSDITGENAKELFVLEGTLANGNFYIYKNYLFKEVFQFKYNELGMMEGVYEGIVKIDLNTGTVTELEPIKFSDWGVHRIIGLSHGKLYSHVDSCEEYENEAVVYWDCETGEKGVIVPGEGELVLAEMNESYLVYKNRVEGQEQQVIYDLSSNEIYDILKVEFNGDLHVFDHELIVEVQNKGFYHYDFATKKLEYWEQPELANFLTILAGFEDGYLCYTVDPTSHVTDEVAFISREELKKGGEPIILTEDGVPVW